MNESIDNFIRAIAEPRFPNMFNPWSQCCATEVEQAGWVPRQERLRRHLACPKPRVLIIGEAPGYQGCRCSGIAFTSERLLLGGAIPRMPAMEGRRITSRVKPWSEPSATIVWKALDEIGLSEGTVMFNAVPWHPEGKAGPLSNRTPTRAERQAGLGCLRMFLELFQGVGVVALGKTASENLKTLGVEYRKIRHPANGGATKFREGLKNFARVNRA